MMSCGQEVMIVADHGKFGRLALARLCGLDEVDQVVTDSGLTAAGSRDAGRGRSGDPCGSGCREPGQRSDSGTVARRQFEERRMSTLDRTDA